MKKVRLSQKWLIVFALVLISGLAIFQYYRYTKSSAGAKRTNAITHMAPVYENLYHEISRVYEENDQKLSTTLLRLNLRDPAIGTLVALGSRTSTQRGSLLKAEGAFFVNAQNSSIGTGIRISDFLRSSKFASGFSYWDFVAEYESDKDTLTCFYNDELKDYYYLYYSHTDLPFELYVLCKADYVNGELAVVQDAASKFVSVILTLLILFSCWLIFSHAYNALRMKRDREAIEAAQRRYKTVLIGKNNYIWEYYLDTDEMLWDESNSRQEILLDISGKKRKSIISEAVVHPDDHWEFFRFCDDLLTDEPVVSAEIRIKADDNSYRWYRLTGNKVYNNSGYPISVIGQTEDIHEVKLENEALRIQASQDSLTKLYNYHYFCELASNRISTNESSEIMALLIIDVDDFNSLNDAFGYVFADAILVDVASRMRKIFPEDTLMGRYGGDEFVALLNKVPSMSYIIDLAQAFLSSAQNVLNSSKSDYKLSCSIGIALYPVDAGNYEQLFEKADIALYDAKNRGKARYSIYNTSMSQLPQAMKEKNKMKRQQTSNSKEHSIVDSTILVNAIDILFDSNDLHFSIGMMLSIIGIYYNLEHLFIVQFDDSDGLATVTHEWSADGHYTLPEEVKNTPRNQFEVFTGFESMASCCYSCDDVTQITDADFINKDPYQTNVKALIQYGIRYQNSFIGFINISCSEPRDWSKNEIDSLSLLAKLISSYLLQLRSQETIEYVSQIDSLTGTYNLNTFLSKSEQAINSNNNKKYAVLYADILQFKLLNDTFGYSIGDMILSSIADILQEVGGSQALVARVTGDRFVALYTYNDEIDLLDKIKKIIYKSKRISQPNGDYYKIVLMMGIYMISRDDSILVAVDRANIARKNVVDYHNCSYMFYKESMHENLIEQREIEDTMEEALQKEEFVVYFQPKMDLKTHELIGSEALVRWIRGDEIVSPVKFIPVFEENGFIVRLDYYVLEKACEAIRNCIDSGYPVRPVSVNFSRVHLNNTALPVMLDVTLKRFQIPPELIEVEITESALNASSIYQLKILNEIHEIGCKLSMDDFGSGMSSLNLLRELPFDIIKIDKDFLHNKVMTTKERIVIRNVVRMATELNMEVICEGVETEEQERFLKEIGCTRGQGYLYSKPIPEDEFIETFVKGK